LRSHLVDREREAGLALVAEADLVAVKDFLVGEGIAAEVVEVLLGAAFQVVDFLEAVFLGVAAADRRAIRAGVARAAVFGVETPVVARAVAIQVAAASTPQRCSAGLIPMAIK
jgi:hypothetical protein